MNDSGLILWGEIRYLSLLVLKGLNCWVISQWPALSGTAVKANLFRYRKRNAVFCAFACHYALIGGINVLIEKNPNEVWAWRAPMPLISWTVGTEMHYLLKFCNGVCFISIGNITYCLFVNLGMILTIWTCETISGRFSWMTRFWNICTRATILTSYLTHFILIKATWSKLNETLWLECPFQCKYRRGSMPVSTVSRKSVRILIIKKIK